MPPRWFLWAGYCTFRYDAVKDKPLDFGQDWFVGLDTGGANWDVLYRHVDRAALREAPTSFVPYKPGVVLDEAPINGVDRGSTKSAPPATSRSPPTSAARWRTSWRRTSPPPGRRHCETRACPAKVETGFAKRTG